MLIQNIHHEVKLKILQQLRSKQYKYDRIRDVQNSTTKMTDTDLKKNISHMTSLISALEQRVGISLSFDTFKITCESRSY